MTPAEVGFELLKLQLGHAVVGGPVPLLWTTIEPADDSGRYFRCQVWFETGFSTRLDFQLDGAVDLTEPDWELRLDRAIFRDGEPGWRH